jgi:hypothetical protein
MTRFPLVALDSTADGLHPATSDPLWREAWYFELYDRVSRVQFHAYQGVFPNAGTGDLNAAFFIDGQRVHETMKMDFTVPPDPIEERLNFGPMKIEMLAPFERWRIRYDAEVGADLIFEALHSPYSWSESRLSMENSGDHEQRSHHFDQFGSYTGTVWAAGKSYPVNALGFRDRMWGWGARRHWTSYVVLWAGFSEDFVVNLSIQNFADGTRGLCGYIHRDGERSVARHARVELHWHPHRWRTVQELSIHIEDGLGREVNLTGAPLGISDTSHQWKHRRDHMLFSVGSYRCGEVVGHGVMNWAFLTEALRPNVLEADLPDPATVARHFDARGA